MKVYFYKPIEPKSPCIREGKALSTLVIAGLGILLEAYGKINRYDRPTIWKIGGFEKSTKR